MLHHKTYCNQFTDEWVTFIHGAGGSSAIWYSQLKEFKKHFNVLLIDLRGHGKSRHINLKPLQHYTVQNISRDVVEVLEHLKIKTSHFVGISLGTIIIWKLALMKRKLVRTMILGGAVMRMNFRARLLMRLGMLLKSVIPYMLLYRFFAWVILPRKNHQHSRRLFIREAQRLCQKEFIRWFRLSGSINRLLATFRGTDTKIPALYIMGEQDHMFLPAVIEVSSLHTNSCLKIIPGCGHVVNIDEPELFNSFSIDFIRKNPIAWE